MGGKGQVRLGQGGRHVLSWIWWLALRAWGRRESVGSAGGGARMGRGWLPDRQSWGGQKLEAGGWG